MEQKQVWLRRVFASLFLKEGLPFKTLATMLATSSLPIRLMRGMSTGLGLYFDESFSYVLVKPSILSCWFLLFVGRMFYFFFESRVSNKDPVVLWLTGGPGCSSQLALFYENGPFQITFNLTLKWNDYGWDQVFIFCVFWRNQRYLLRNQ